MHEFFEANGLTSIHYDYGGIARTISNNTKKKIVPLLGKYESFDFLCDMEFVCDWDHPVKGVTSAFSQNYRDLDKAYPGAKFILNTRNILKWLNSRANHGDGVYMKRYMNIYNETYDQVIARWARDWNIHHTNVLEYFQNREEDLLVLDLETGVGQCRKTLEEFFGDSFDYSYFGHTHKTKVLKVA